MPELTPSPLAEAIVGSARSMPTIYDASGEWWQLAPLRQLFADGLLDLPKDRSLVIPSELGESVRDLVVSERKLGPAIVAQLLQIEYIPATYAESVGVKAQEIMQRAISLELWTNFGAHGTLLEVLREVYPEYETGAIFPTHARTQVVTAPVKFLEIEGEKVATILTRSEDINLYFGSASIAKRIEYPDLLDMYQWRSSHQKFSLANSVNVLIGKVHSEPTEFIWPPDIANGLDVSRESLQALRQSSESDGEDIAIPEVVQIHFARNGLRLYRATKRDPDQLDLFPDLLGR